MENFESSGDRAQKTWGIIIPNIIHLNITYRFDPNIYMCLNSDRCKGVSIQPLEWTPPNERARDRNRNVNS